MASTSVTPQERFFDSNGVHIRYVAAGRGPVIVLLHGLTGSLDHWIGIGFYDDRFDGFQLIAMDCRGHGKSGKPHTAAAYGQEMVDDVVRLLDYLEIRRAHVLGHSMGAEIALKMASQYPARVHSAVLAGSGWSDDNVYECWRLLAESFERGEGLRGLFEWATLPGQTRTAEEVEGFEQWNQTVIAQQDTQALGALCRNYVELTELLMTEEEMRAIRVPMLGVAGELDPERPMLERMSGVAPDFRLIVLEGLGHGGPEFFQALAEHAFSFLREVDPQQG